MNSGVIHKLLGLDNVNTLPNQYLQNAENVQILHRYHKITGILCKQFAGLILNMSENIEISMYLILQITLMGVPTIDQDCLVMNVNKRFFCPNQLGKKLFTYIHHCTFLYDHKFDNYCELLYWILFTT